jgi:Cu/Ag efflux pump CusA
VGNGKHGKEMNDNFAAVGKKNTASEGTCSKTCKSLVTLKDRAKLNNRLFNKRFGNGELGEEMNESLAAVESEDTACEVPVRSTTGKSSVTLKDRAVLNVRLSQQGPGKITGPTQWRFEENGDDR